MARWKGITAEELLILREVERINYQIRQAASQLGKSSRLYQQYENVLTPTNRPGLTQGLMAKHNKAGVLQLSIAKKDIKQYVLGSYNRDLQQLGKMPTIGQVKQEMISAYEARTGMKVKTRAERRVAYEREKQYDQGLFDQLTGLLGRYYELEKKQGVEFSSHQKLRDISKGVFTSQDDLKQMLQIVTDELERERHQIADDYLAGL